MTWTTEAKVGLFTILGIILLSICVIFLGKFELFSPPQITITGQFTSVNGLKEGNAVKFSGVKVGRVEKMEVHDKGVIITMKINKDVQIPKDSEFSMQNDGILGDKFIQITPGKSSTYISDGDSIVGDGASEIDKTMAEATNLMKSANTTLESINGIIGDKETQNALRNTLRTTETISKNVADMTAQMNELMRDNKGNVNEIAHNMVGITKNMESLTNQMDESMKSFNGDGQAGAQMRQIVDNLKTTTDSVAKMAGAMEGVVTDPQSANDIKETLHNTAQLTTKLNRLTGGDVKGSDAGKKLDIKTNAGAEMLYDVDGKRVSANASFRLFLDKHAYELGLTNIGDGTHVEATYGTYIGKDFMWRTGLFDGDVGIGLDYGLGNKYSLSAALMDVSHRRYRVRSELQLKDNLYGVFQWVKPQHESSTTYFGVRTSF